MAARPFASGPVRITASRATSRNSARDARLGQELLDVTSQPPVLKVELLSATGRAGADRGGTTEPRDQPLPAAARRLVDDGDGIRRKARSRGDGFWDLAVEERHAEPLGHPRSDHAVARPVQRGKRHDWLGLSRRKYDTFLESTEVASAEGRIRIGRHEEGTRLADHAVDRSLTVRIVRPDRLIELGDQHGYRSDPTEPQVVGGSLQGLACGHPTAEPLRLDALRLQQLAVQFEQRPA
jgi:hypothetical protein